MKNEHTHQPVAQKGEQDATSTPELVDTNTMAPTSPTETKYKHNGRDELPWCCVLFDLKFANSLPNRFLGWFDSNQTRTDAPAQLTPSTSWWDPDADRPGSAQPDSSRVCRILIWLCIRFQNTPDRRAYPSLRWGWWSKEARLTEHPRHPSQQGSQLHQTAMRCDH